MDEVIVYYYFTTKESFGKKEFDKTLEWKPFKLLKYFKKLESKEDDSIFFCPSILSRIKRTYVINAFENINIFKEDTHQKTEKLNNGNHILLNYKLFLFSNEPLEVLISDPFFYNRENKGFFVIPSALDIGQRFRPIDFSFIVFDKEISIKKDEPILYLEFLTNKKIIFKEFQFTEAHLNLMDMPRGMGNQNPRYLSLEVLYSEFFKKKEKLLELFN